MIYCTISSLNLVLHYLKMKHTMLSDAKLALYQILQFWITEHAFMLFSYTSLVIHMLWQKHGTLTRNKKKYSYGLCCVNNTYLHPDRLVPRIWFLLLADVVKRVAVKLLGCRIWRFLHQAHGAHRYAYKLVYATHSTVREKYLDLRAHVLVDEFHQTVYVLPPEARTHIRKEKGRVGSFGNLRYLT